MTSTSSTHGVRVLVVLASLCALLTGGAGVAQGAASTAAANGSPAVLAARTAPAAAPVNAGWQTFRWSFDGVATQVFTVTTRRAVRVTLTDTFCRGDAFVVRSGGRVLERTPPVAASCALPLVGDPDVALRDPSYSHGSFVLRPGTHRLVIEAVVNPFLGGIGAIRFDSPPRPR